MYLGFYVRVREQAREDLRPRGAGGQEYTEEEQQSEGSANQMKKFFRNLKKYQRYAIRNAKAELNSEVADSYLNWLCGIIDPLAFMMIYTFIFTVAFKTRTSFFASSVWGLTVWDFFNRMIRGSVNLIHSKP